MNRDREETGGERGRLSPALLAGLALAALAAAWAIERAAGPPGARAPAEAAARAASARDWMAGAVARLRQERLQSGAPRDPALLPDDSPLLGCEIGPLVTTLGTLEAKRMAASPDWARVLSLRLRGAGVGEGSFVAASFSGSFPGLNLALIAACRALGADLAAVSSVTASSWGASEPGWTWPETEWRLVRAGVMRRASAGISVGGERDQALDLEPEARELAMRIASSAARELGAELMRPASLGEAAAARLALYAREARGRPVALYVNIGGSQVSMGDSIAVLRLGSGFLRERPFDLTADRGVIARFMERGTPVLSLLNVRDLALRWGVQERGE